MSEARAPTVYTIPFHRAFADALAQGLLDRFGRDPFALSRGTILLPNNRAVRALTEAFVRRAEGGGLLLPRLVPVGDVELDERLGLAFDDLEAPVPPAIDDCARQLTLARLTRALPAGDRPPSAGEAVRLAGQLARTLDQLVIERVDPSRLADAVPAELASHWQRTLAFLDIVLRAWPQHLAEQGLIDLADRRNRLLDRVARQWRESPPVGFVVAAGIHTGAPAIVALLRSVARLPQGMVVLHGLDRAMADAEWDGLDSAGEAGRAAETHPQFLLREMLDGLSVRREEVLLWPRAGGRDAPAARSRAVNHALCTPAATAAWQALPPRARRLPGVKFLEAATPAEEAQAIALALREVLETPAKTAALVTPDRGLARRVAAHLARWGIGIDDTAGRPLSREPAGTLLAALASAAAEGFPPVALLALLKHPLVRSGEERLAWLDGVRLLDRALRGVRPAPGLAGITDRLAGANPLREPEREQARSFWREAQRLLRPLEVVFAEPSAGMAALVRVMRESAQLLAGDAAWRGPAGRSAADLVEHLEQHADLLGEIETAEFPSLLAAFLDESAVRPPYGGHPRLAIYGLIEARLQRADLMILGGLNEGVWPPAPRPDPWLAPRIRAELGLPGLERQIGLTAHDFAASLGAPEVLVTRARRDATAPTVASRFWLRLEAMTGGMPRAHGLAALAREIDCVSNPRPARRPAPSPPPALRPRTVSVTEVDTLKADPFAFYAKRLLRLRLLDPLDADPTAAERGTAVHRLLQEWHEEGGHDPARLVELAREMVAGWDAHPLLRHLWAPRLEEAVRWVASELAERVKNGWQVAAVERSGEATVDGVTLKGKADRIDANAGALTIVDYKTGAPPSGDQVEAGYALQLGLLGWLAEQGAFAKVRGMPAAYAYWTLKKTKGQFGGVIDPCIRNRQPWIDPADFAAHAAQHFREAAARWLTGSEPFPAKLHPIYARYADYDQLARVEEWLGRENG